MAGIFASSGVIASTAEVQAETLQECFDRLLVEMVAERRPVLRHLPMAEIYEGRIISISRQALKSLIHLKIGEGPLSRWPKEEIPEDNYRVILVDSTRMWLEDGKGDRYVISRKKLNYKKFPMSNGVPSGASPIRIGDYVMVGNLSSIDKTPIPLVTVSGDKIERLNPFFIPAIGKIVNVEDDGNIVLRLRFLAKNRGKKISDIYDGNYRVERKYLLNLAGGNQGIADKVLEPTLNIHLSFSNLEQVRFRGEDHRMHLGVVLSHLPGSSEIRDDSGAISSVQESNIFKYVAENVSSPIFEGQQDSAEIEYSDPLVVKALNGAAKLSSIEGFSKLSEVEQIEALTQYVRTVLPYNNAASFAEINGLTHMSDLICAGAGTCRHQSTILAAVLSEAGYSVRPTYFEYRDSEGHMTAGHRWLEVDIRDTEKKLKTFVVDATSEPGHDILPLTEVLESAKKPENFEDRTARYYGNPKRQHRAPISP